METNRYTSIARFVAIGKKEKQLRDKEYITYEALGHSFYHAAAIAVLFPEDFAETVARWNPEDLDKIIDALEKERRRLNG